jgi:hypothetical protein
VKNRLLIVGALIAVGLAVGAMLYRSAAKQVGNDRAELVGELLAGGVE